MDRTFPLGFSVFQGVFEGQVLCTIAATIKQQIADLAQSLDCPVERYLKSVSRWANPSPVTDAPLAFVEKNVKRWVERTVGEEVKLQKINVISKSKQAIGSVPAHQDISYSPQTPYEFSTWIPLQEVTLNNGVMEVLPKSHLGPIDPAVDFWVPDFQDKKARSAEWLESAIPLPLQIGDVLLFDSRLWHRSRESLDGKERFAIVARWSRLSYQPPKNIPPLAPAPLGMWTCGTKTLEMMQNYLKTSQELSFIECLDACIQKTRDPQVQSALDDLKILHLASQNHGGGDALGVVYPKLWKVFP